MLSLILVWFARATPIEVSNSSRHFSLYRRLRLVSRFTRMAWLVVMKRLLEEGARENLEFMLERRVWGKGGK
jgi:hypothetical protein